MRQETPPKAPSAWSRPAPAALVAIAAAVLLTSGLHALRLGLERRRLSHTGKAEWIWYARAGRKPQALRFTATRDVSLAAAPARAEARFLVQPEYALSVNGQAVAAGHGRPGDPLTVVDLTPFLRPGTNRIAIEASSPDGVGGILFAVSGEGLDADAFASGPEWRVRSSSSPDAAEARAIVWGKPPQYPWGYPRLP